MHISLSKTCTNLTKKTATKMTTRTVTHPRAIDALLLEHPHAALRLCVQEVWQVVGVVGGWAWLNLATATEPRGHP